MTHDYFSRTGDLHLHCGKENEDRISVLERSGLTAAALCDGAGSALAGAAAAALTSRTLTELLAARFEELYASDTETARLTVIQTVEQRLRAYSRRTATPLQELACTILAAAVAEDGRCICFHLGDGIILQKNESDRAPSVVSCPMTGLAPHSTYLTMNCDLGRYLRCYRWKCPELTQLMMMTDGAADHLVRLSGGAGWIYAAEAHLDVPRILAHLTQKNPRDDYSTVLISRIPEQAHTNPENKEELRCPTATV